MHSIKKNESQLHKQGTLHCNYNIEVNDKVPHERPQSIIIGLDAFNLLYESEPGDVVKTIYVKRGHVVLFTSSLSHAGGSNGEANDNLYKYWLFAYIVLEESNYPAEAATRVNIC